MHHDVSFRRVRLPAQTVTSHGGDLVVPEKSQSVPGGLHARVLGVFALRVGPDIFYRHLLVVFFGQADADEQNVAPLKLDVAILHDRVDLGERNVMTVERAVRNAFLFRPSRVVDEHSSTYNGGKTTQSQSTKNYRAKIQEPHVPLPAIPCLAQCWRPILSWSRSMISLSVVPP